MKIYHKGIFFKTVSLSSFLRVEFEYILHNKSVQDFTAIHSRNASWHFQTGKIKGNDVTCA